MIKSILKLFLILTFLPMSVVTVSAEETTLILSHFLSPKSPPHVKFIEPWARKIEKDSKGKVKIEIYPSMVLGGKPPELYRQLRDGAADIVWTVTGYTPGVFPRVEAFELPTVHRGSARATSLAIQDSFDLISDDFKDIKPILVYVHAGNALHLVNGCAENLNDLKGLKIRTPSRTGGWLIDAWGAEPVGIPLPSLPQALSKGTVDGALIPFEIVPPIKVHELTKCSVTAINDARFGTSVFLFAMNKKRFEGLSADVQAVIEANSGAVIAEQVGMLWNEMEKPGISLQKKTGSPIHQLSKKVSDQMDKLGETVVKRWVAEAKKSGINADELIKKARASVIKNSR